MSSVRSSGMDSNNLNTSFQTESETNIERIVYFILYYFAIFVNWLYEIYIHITENPITIVWTICGFIGLLLFRKIYKFAREKILAKQSLEKIKKL